MTHRIRIDALSTFPHIYDSFMGESMMKRAQEKGILDFRSYDLREWTYDRHKTTDDYPYGGGSGLVMKCEPIFEAVESILGLKHGTLPDIDQRKTHDATIVFLSPHGSTFDDACASRLAKKDHLLFVCGHYEGIDERVYSIADEMISLGDYVLTSGELASMVVIDATVRKIPGVLGAADGAIRESFSTDLLEYPQYTRPSEFRGMEVPDVLLSGHHANISRWQREKSIEVTLARRPDLVKAWLDGPDVSSTDLDYLESLLDGA